MPDELDTEVGHGVSGSFIIGSEAQPCWHCEIPTRYIEVNFEANLHPGDCAEAKWQEYEEASERMGPIDYSGFEGQT